jgi:filamentous hemagglutinin family protein
MSKAEKHAGKVTLRVAVRRVLSVVTPATLSLLGATPAVGGPEDGVVVRGAASIEHASPNTLNIHQTTDRAAINWRSFSIGANEQVNFIQPSSTSATLNRVTGGQQSVINGVLSANGQVFLLNPSGVLFGRSARVDVGGLVATTSELGDDDFMSGKLEFTAAARPDAQVVNDGSISVHDGGLGALVAPSVRNQGVISARLGRIALGAGEQFTIDPYGDQLINFALPSAAGSALAPREIQQSGTLLADGGRVLLTTDAMAGVIGDVVNMSGVIQARTAERNTAGEIVLSGNDVSVSGVLDVSAADQGDAGRVNIWGTDSAQFDGTILARGGAQGGDGGFVELSGRREVQFAGTLEAQAPHGKGGTLLIDPENITIEPVGSSDLTSATISGAAIRNLLRQGTMVQLLADNTITVNDIIDGRPVSGQSQSGGGVDFRAGSILVLQPIITNNGSIVLTATQGNLTFDSNAFLVVASSTSASGLGTAPITLSAAQNVAVNQVISLGRVAVTATSGNVQLLQALNGLQTASGPSGIGELAVTAGGQISTAGVFSTSHVALDAGTALTVAGPITAQGDIALTARSAGGSGITVGGAGAAGVAALVAGGNVALATPAAVTLNNSVVARGGNVAIGSAAQRVASVTSAAGAVVQSVESATATDQNGDISIYTSSAFTAQDLIAGTAGDVLVDAAGPVTLTRGLFGLQGSNGIGSLTVNAAGALTTNGARTSGGINLTSTGALQNSTASLISTAGAVNLSGSSIALDQIMSGGNVAAAVDAGGDVTFATAGAVTLSSGVLSRGGNVRIGSAGQRTASVAMAAGTSVSSSASSTDADQDGDISIFTIAPFSAQDLLAGASGDVQVDSLGAVTFNRGLFGVTGSPGIGSLTVNAGGPLTLNGAHTTGSMALTSSGALQNSTASLVADAGAISLTGTSVTLNAITVNGTPAAAVDAGGNLTIATAGAVALNGNATSRGGNIQVGSSAQRVASLTMANGTALQSVGSTGAADQDGDISIFTAGGFSAQDLIAGTAGDVLINAQGAVTLNRGLFGLQGSNGIGSLTVNTTAGTVALNGARTSGAINVTSGGAVQNSTASLISNNGAISLSGSAITLNSITDAAGNVTLAASGAVNVNSSVLARTGNIQIGSNAQPVASLTTATGTVLRSDAPAGAINVRATGAVTTRDLVTGASGAVDLSGSSVTVDGTINDPTGTSGVGQVAIAANTITVDGIRVSNALQGTVGSSTELVRLITGNTGATVNVNGPIVSGGRVRIGRSNDAYTAGSGNIRINLSNDISTAGQSVTLAGDVMLFNNISRWDIECAVTGLCVPNHQREFDIALFDPLLFAPGTFQTGFQTLLTNVERYVQLCTQFCAVGTITGDDAQMILTRGQQLVLAQQNFLAFDLVGGAEVELSAYNSYTNCPDAYICGLSNATPLNVEIALAAERYDRMARLLGGLTATIDTTLGSAAGAPVTFAGDVERYRGAVPAPAPFGTSPLPILPTFVSHSLAVNAGTGGTITVVGELGDVARVGVATMPSQANMNNLPRLELGTFSVVLTGASYDLGASASPPALSTLSFNGTPVTPLGLEDAYFYNWPFSQTGAGTFQGGGGANTSVGAGATFQATPGAGGLSLFGSGGSGAGVGGSAAGSASQSAGLAGGLAGFGGLPPINEPVPDVPPTATDTERRDEGYESAEDQSGGNAVADAERCPRGAAELADLGTERAIDGAAPDVFERCEE